MNNKYYQVMKKKKGTRRWLKYKKTSTKNEALEAVHRAKNIFINYDFKFIQKI